MDILVPAQGKANKSGDLHGYYWFWPGPAPATFKSLPVKGRSPVSIQVLDPRGLSNNESSGLSDDGG